MAKIENQRKALSGKGKETELPSNSRSIPEEEQRHKKFPKISQIITERKIWMTGVVILLGLLIICLGNDVLEHIQQKQHIDQKRAQLQSQIEKWEQVIHQYPDYRDGYFMLATLTYQEGDISSSLAYTKKTIAIDPNFVPAQTLEKLLEIKTVGKQ